MLTDTAAQRDERWYVAETRPHIEAVIAQAVAEKKYTVFLPLEMHTARHARRIKTSLRPMISGYLFVRFDIRQDAWAELASLQGVVGFLGMRADSTYNGFRPTPARRGEIERLMEASNIASQPKPLKTLILPRLTPETRALIFEGVLAGIEGFVIRDDRGRTLIALDKRFGGKTVSMPRESVRQM